MKKEQNKQKRKERKRSEGYKYKSIRQRVIIGAIVLAAAVVGVSSFMLYSNWRAGEIKNAEAPIISISPQYVDLGRVSQAKGVVTAFATVENLGEGDLIINDMETSCGCTTAALIIDGEEGPAFGMRGHGSWPKGWSATIKSGKQAQLKINYDPNVHGTLRGLVTRVIYIYSNDPRNPVMKITVEAYQTE